MDQQEQALHDTWKILRLEQEKEKLHQEYLDRITAINLEIFQLQNRVSQCADTRVYVNSERL